MTTMRGGIDLGGTKIQAVVVDEHSTVAGEAREATPTEGTKSDVIRAAVGYALAGDAIGLERFREKYAPLMTGEADRLAFEAASKPAAWRFGYYRATFG